MLKIQFPFDTDEKFLVITAKPHIVMEEAEKVGLTDTSNQWLFFLLKNTTSKHGALPIMKYVNEGSNIAVAINSTITKGECSVSVSGVPEKLFLEIFFI